MPRDFYESVAGMASSVDSKFVVMADIEVWVYPRNVATLADFRTKSPQLALIYQRDIGVAGGPSPEAGATGGPNPFVTGASGSIQFWAERGDYDIFLHDIVVPARISDRLIPWNAVTRGGVSEADLLAAVTDLFIPIGVQLPTGALGDPPGDRFKLCDGRLISIAQYPAYHAAVGHKYNNYVDPGGGFVRLPDKRGRVSVGADTMGTAQGSANRMSVYSDVIGQSGGIERVQLTTAEMPSHGHSVSDPWHSHGVQPYVNGGGNVGHPYTEVGYNSQTWLGVDTGITTPSGTGISVAANGSGGSHNNMPPYQVDNWIVRVR